MTAADVKEKRPLSDLACETRRNNALRTNELRRAKKAAAAAAPVAPAADEDVTELVRQMVDQRLDERLAEAKSSSNFGALALLGVQLLANSSVVPALVSMVTKKRETPPPPSTETSGLSEWLDGA